MTVKLVISDVDGTIVQPDKSLSPGTIAAAARLQAAGVKLAVVSARPPRGMAYITTTLKLTAPFAGFNGGMLVGPDGATVEWNPAPADLVHQAIALFDARGIDTWLFTQDEWLIRDPQGAHVEHEKRTVRFDPRIVDDFAPYVNQVGKLVGVSEDYPKLAAIEAELHAIVGDGASAVRSQKYYLDLTHRDANKGAAVGAIARHLGVTLDEVAVLGDMPNDIPMFRVAGFSVAMGNGSVDAKAAATATTTPNDHEGWAAAIDTLILPKARPC
jgi:Cof subfamily protein (haloacid dehalogenase superfamily)